MGQTGRKRRWNHEMLEDEESLALFIFCTRLHEEVWAVWRLNPCTSYNCEISSPSAFVWISVYFLAALSSSKSLVVCLSARPSVRSSVHHVCEKGTFRVSKGN